MTFELIPGGLAQEVFLLDGGNWNTLAVASVVLSCISTAFTITAVDFDLDTNKGTVAKNQSSTAIFQTPLPVILGSSCFFSSTTAPTLSATRSTWPCLHKRTGCGSWRTFWPTIAASYSTSSCVAIWCTGSLGLVYRCPCSIHGKGHHEFHRVRRLQPAFSFALTPRLSPVPMRTQHQFCCAAGVFTFATRSSWVAFTSSSMR
jgi:hypothetical protein